TIRYGLDYVMPSPQERAALRRAVREELGVDDACPLVGIACRLVEQKGVAYGLRAFAQVSHRFDDAKLIIAGDGPLRHELEAEATSLGLSKRVQFIGWCDDVPRLMCGLDVLLLPSLWEGFGLV